MAAPPTPRRTAARVDTLLGDTETALGLSLTVHEWLGAGSLGGRWRQHRSPACLVHKRSHDGICIRYGGGIVHDLTAGRRDGWLHTCPYGFTEVAAPLHRNGRYAGVLFAGTCWLEPSPPPLPGLIIPSAPGWLEARIAVVRAVADRLTSLLWGEPGEEPTDRRSRIVGAIVDAGPDPVDLRQIARLLVLSPSRTAHVVAELFGKPLGLVVREVRLQESARLLAMSALSVADIASRTGFPDPNYFSRVFARTYGLPPRAYRTAKAVGV